MSLSFARSCSSRRARYLDMTISEEKCPFFRNRRSSLLKWARNQFNRARRRERLEWEDDMDEDSEPDLHPCDENEYCHLDLPLHESPYDYDDYGDLNDDSYYGDSHYDWDYYPYDDPYDDGYMHHCSLDDSYSDRYTPERADEDANMEFALSGEWKEWENREDPDDYFRDAYRMWEACQPINPVEFLPTMEEWRFRKAI